jgi:hypothetical protein
MKRLAMRLLGDRRGQSVVEFAIAMPFLVLMSVGTFAVGMILDRHLTLGQVVRNGGNMYARGIDFSINQNKQFIIDAGTGLDLHLLGGGKTAVWFTLLTRVPDTARCPNGSGGLRDCINNGRIVVVQRYQIGDTTGSGMTSRLQSGQLATQFVNKSGAAAVEGDHVNYLDMSEAWADNAPGALTNAATGLLDNELMYVVEVIHRPTSISFQGIFAPEYMYARAFF